jgi:trp repressor protein
MLRHGISYSGIEKTIGVSRATIARVRQANADLLDQPDMFSTQSRY